MATSSAAATAAAALFDTHDGHLHPDFIPHAAQRQQLELAIAADRAEVNRIESNIEDTILHLRRVQAELHLRISTLRSQCDVLDKGIQRACSVIGAVRKLPPELLAAIFAIAGPPVPWSASGVCVKWRRAALASRELWTKIHMSTSGSAKSADAIRLWLDRSGPSLPLDIQIELVRKPKSTKLPGLPDLQPASVRLARTRREYRDQQPTEHPNWTHINLFYLFQHIGRWQRFVFKFDCPLPAITTLQLLQGTTPLLEEFEIARKDPPVNTEYMNMSAWQWLPSFGTASAPRLHTLTLRHMPYDFCSPFMMSSATLERLILVRMREPSGGQSIGSSDTLHALLSKHAPTLRVLHLDTPNLASPFVPLTTIRMPLLEELAWSGGPSVVPMLQQIHAPALRSLSLDVDTHNNTSPADALHELLIRSDLPALRALAIGTTRPNSLHGYTGAGTRDLSDPDVLAKLGSVRELRLNTHIEDVPQLLHALGGQPPAMPLLDALTVHISHLDGPNALMDLIEGIRLRKDSGVPMPTLELRLEVPLAKERENWLRERVPKLDVTFEGNMPAQLQVPLNQLVHPGDYYAPVPYDILGLPPPPPPPPVNTLFHGATVVQPPLYDIASESDEDAAYPYDDIGY